MTEEERRDMITEARHFSLAAPLIIPLIEKRRSLVLNRLYGQHRDGSTNYVGLVAELSVLRDLEQEIHQKIQIIETMERQDGSAAKR